MLTLTDITLTYPDGDERLVAVDGANLRVGPGEFTAITGPSGSGKSSLLSVAATLTTPDSGRLDLGGVDALALSPAQKAALRRKKLGIVFQAPNLIPSLSVAEQLEVMARIGGRRGRGFASLPTNERRARIRGTLASVGMERYATRKPGQLSGGQRQRVNIARAIVHEPAVMLVDEPTSALDRERGEEVINLLGRLTRERGLATVVVTHDEAQLPEFDSTFRMVDGVLITSDAGSQKRGAPHLLG